MMHDEDDARIESWLIAQRPVPAADLAARILSAAHRTPPRRTLSFGGWLRETFAECHLPAPSYALAAMLALGLGLGTLIPAVQAESGETWFWNVSDQEILP